MAVPTVFVSSTCYDLAHIRASLRGFIEGLGYIPVLSEEGGVFYDPAKHVIDSALSEVTNAHLFVLIIGGRSGASVEATGKSVTNAEYEEARANKIPVFALVSATVLTEYYVYRANRDARKAVDIVYPSVDDVRIFEFIDEVRTATVNNALVPFSTYAEMERYLRLQWAAMMHAFLSRAAETARVADTLSLVTDMNRRIELLSEQILSSVGSGTAKLTVELYDLMLGRASLRDLTYFGVRPAPRDVLLAEGFLDCASRLGANVTVEEERDESAISRFTITRPRLDHDEADFNSMQDDLREHLKEASMSVESYTSTAS